MKAEAHSSFDSADSNADASSEETDGRSDDGLYNPRVGDEEHDSDVEIDPTTLAHLGNLGRDPSSKSYTLSGLNRVVGLKLVAKNEYFVPMTRPHYDAMVKEILDPKKPKRKKQKDDEFELELA